MWGPNTIVKTPHIDRLAHEGVICTRAYATAAVCSPCRAAMMTGWYPQNTGVPTNNFKLRNDVPTQPPRRCRAGGLFRETWDVKPGM
jgi:arylsulfatase A-like enzyme